MNAEQRLQRVSELTSAWLDGRAGESGLVELNALLGGDPNACERYLELMEIHAALSHDHAGDAEGQRLAALLPLSAETGAAVPGPGRDFARRWRALPWTRLAAAAAAGALLANAAVLWLRPRLPSEGADERPLLAAEAVAVLSRAVEPVWLGGGEALSPGEGEAIPAGRFALRSGLVQLEFFSGATLIVEGPADLHLESAWRVRCHEGRLRIFVPEPARGFTVAAPGYEAVDLGTEFALSVGSDGRGEIHVVDGEVRLDDEAGQTLGLLEGGGAARLDEGRMIAIASRGEAFVDRRQMLGLAQEDWRARYAAWQGAREGLRDDPAALVYLDFEEQELWDRHLENRARGVGAGGGGAIIGAPWTQGRWPGKGALEFKRITDRVRLQVPGEHQALTLMAWVRIEGLDQWLSSLLLTDGFDPGEVHWQVSDRGELILGIAGAEPANSFSPPVILPRDLGSWRHLAVTVAGGRVVHYLDGKAVSEHRLVSGFAPLRLGPSEIGNWQSGGLNHPIRSLNGRVDEFAVLSRALLPEEIRSLWNAGLPSG